MTKITCIIVLHFCDDVTSNQFLIWRAIRLNLKQKSEMLKTRFSYIFLGSPKNYATGEARRFPVKTHLYS